MSLAAIIGLARSAVELAQSLVKLVLPEPKPVNPLSHLDAELQARASRRAGHESEPLDKRPGTK